MEKFILKEERIHKFTIEEEVDGTKLKGDFISKYPSITDEMNIHVAMSQRLSGANASTVSDVGSELAYMMSVADVLLIEKPDWFDFETLGDRDILTKVVEEILVFNNSFRNSNEKDRHSKLSTKQQDEEIVEGK